MKRGFKRFLVLVLTLVATVSACQTAAVDPEKARSFADEYMNDLISDQRDNLYNKMEPEFHDLVSRGQFGSSLESLYAEFGKPDSFHFDSYGIGIRAITAGPHVGQTKPTCEILYTVKTSKGVFPFKVKVLNTNGGLSVTSAVFIERD